MKLKHALATLTLLSSLSLFAADRTELRKQDFWIQLIDGNGILANYVVPPDYRNYDSIRLRLDCKLAISTAIWLERFEHDSLGSVRCLNCFKGRPVPIQCDAVNQHIEVNLTPHLGRLYSPGDVLQLLIYPPPDAFVEWRALLFYYEARVPENGESGRDGIPGIDGAPGRDGKDGKDGKDGRDGAPGVCKCDDKDHHHEYDYKRKR